MLNQITFDLDTGWFVPGKLNLPDGRTADLIIDKTPNTSGSLDARSGVGIIEHYTASMKAKRAQAWLDDPRARASAHFIVGDRDELVIYQTVSLYGRSWHAGDGRINGRNPNDFCWGIEHSNAGFLTETANGFQTWYGDPVPPEEVIWGPDHKGVNKEWDDYDKETIVMSMALHHGLRDFVTRKGWTFLDCWAHSDAAPDRKSDPGPGFPMGQMRGIMGDRENLPVAVVPERTPKEPHWMDEYKPER